MKKRIWPTRNLYFQHIDPEQLKLHEPEPTRSEAAARQRARTKAASDDLKMRKKLLTDAYGAQPIGATRPEKKRVGAGDWHVMNNDK